MFPDQFRLHFVAKPLSRGLCPAAFLLLLFDANFASAQATHIVERGTDGLAEILFEARNDGAEAIACGASLAHWHSLELGEAAPGESVAATLYLDPASGEMYLLNDSEDRMAVELLWCGIAGRSWATRDVIELARRAGETPAPIHLVCTTEADRLICR